MFEPKVKINTLINLISFVKFESRDYESRYFAGSPIVGEILSELLNQFNTGKEITFHVELNSPFGRTLINSIKWHLEQTDEWRKMKLNDKLEHIRNLASPYLLEEETIHSIVDFRSNLDNG
jgi:hypothetical protein